MTRIGISFSLILLAAISFVWMVARDNHAALDRVAPPDEGTLVVEVTAEGVPIRTYREDFDWRPRLPDGEGRVAYVNTLAGPVALVMERGVEGMFTIGWVARRQPGNPCLADVEVYGDELRVIAYRLTESGQCESSRARTFLVGGFLGGTPRPALAPTVIDTFRPVSAYDPHISRPPLTSSL